MMFDQGHGGHSPVTTGGGLVTPTTEWYIVMLQSLSSVGR